MSREFYIYPLVIKILILQSFFVFLGKAGLEEVIYLARQPKQKELQNTKLLKEYASWVYCTACNKTVAYLCYVTYDFFEFEYIGHCGNHGKVYIQFDHEVPVKDNHSLLQIKNRLCCPQDNSPLITVVGKNLKTFRFRIVCNTCNTEYSSQ